MLEARRTTPLAWLGQLVLYAAFMLVIGVFSRWPVYQHLAPDQALVKVSFIHTGKPLGECKTQSEAELAKLPPNMRAPTRCPRERSPVRIEVDIGGVTALSRSAPPTGLSRDGASALYERLVVPAGAQRIAVRLNDDARSTGFSYQREAHLTLAPAQVLVIDFDPERGGITIQ